MNICHRKIFWVAILLAVFLVTPGAAAQQSQQSHVSQLTGCKQKKAPPVPDLADLIPLEIKLSGRLAVLEKTSMTAFNPSPVEKGLTRIAARLAQHIQQFEDIKVPSRYSYDKALGIRGAIYEDGKALDVIIKPLIGAIRRFAQARKTWLAERKRWTAWQSVMLKQDPFAEVKKTFDRAQATIDKALLLMHQHLQPLLVLLQRAGDLENKIDALTAEVDEITLSMHREIRPEITPSMFSARYLYQLRSQALYELKGGMQALAWPEAEFFRRQGWLLLFQFLIALAVMAIIFRSRGRLATSERWGFLAQRPITTGIFLGFAPIFPFYQAPPLSLILFLGVIVGISGARLLGSLLEKPWQRLLIYVLIFFLLATRLLTIIGLPYPIFRLYIVLLSLVGLGLCWWVSSKTGSVLYTWAYRLGALFFVAILIGELGAYSRFAEYLMRGSLRTLAIILAAWLLMYLARGGIEGLVYHTALQRVPLVSSNPDEAVRRLSRILDFLIMALNLGVILVIWRVYSTPTEAIKGVFSLGVTVGSFEITLGHIISAALVLYGSFLLSWALRNLLMLGVLAKSKTDVGTQHSITALFHYVLVFVGFLLALSVLGFQLTQLTIMLSALGVGIGFGLQQIVNNFVCGLIMLFERPVKIGDFLEISGQWVEVRKIGLRATVVRTLDHAEIVVPNSDLITSKVTNWTLSDRRVRLIIPVGVAYGSEVALVIETLWKCANANLKVLKKPEPMILFRKFGDSSLEFELRFYTLNPSERLQIISELHQEIDREFRLAGIEIAFPQRDLHVRSVDESAAARLHSPEPQPLDLVGGDRKGEKSQ